MNGAAREAGGRLRFPCVSLGGTSWVIEGGFAENMQELSNDVDAMQFVLFEGDYGSNIPSKDEIAELAELKDRLSMETVVHFPHDIDLAYGDAERTRCEDCCLRIMELFAPLSPYAYVMHFAGEIRNCRLPSADMAAWDKNILLSVRRLAASADDKKTLCAETLNYDFDTVYPAIIAAGISACLDIGHLLRYGYDAMERLGRYLPATRLLHIHGVMPDGTDHTEMSNFDAGLFRKIIKLLGDDGTPRVMILEVFEGDYKKSLAAIKDMMSG